MDRTLLKISGIIAVIIGIGWCITVIGIVIGILLIIGGMKFISYADATDKSLIKNKNSILGWSIFFIFFTVIGGIIGIVAYLLMNGDLDSVTKYAQPNNKKDENISKKLSQIKELYDGGLISKEEYEEKRRKLLDL